MPNKKASKKGLTAQEKRVKLLQRISKLPRPVTVTVNGKEVKMTKKEYEAFKTVYGYTEQDDSSQDEKFISSNLI